MMSKLLYTSEHWEVEDLEKTWKVIDKIAREKYNLKYRDTQFEIVSRDEMVEKVSINGAFPSGYSHWSFGKNYLRNRELYNQGRMSGALEVIINTDPAIVYIIENNSMTQQAMVMAHAGVGHNHMNTHNLMINELTSSRSILSFLEYAKRFIKDCEVRYGASVVEFILDSCHMLASHSFDNYKRIPHTKERHKKQYLDYIKNYEYNYDELIDERRKEYKEFSKIELPENNLLYFIEKCSPADQWLKEIVRIVRKINQHLSVVGLTKIMHEGYATFWHYQLMNDLYDEGYISDEAYLAFLDSHCNLSYFADGHMIMSVDRLPYFLGFNIFKEIKRVCENPTKEDKEYCPWAGNNWQDEFQFACEYFIDSSFIQQYLTPRLIKEYGFYSLLDDLESVSYKIEGIHSKKDFERIKNTLAEQISFINKVPSIEIVKYSKVDNFTVLRYNEYEDRELDEENKIDVLATFSTLMNGKVIFE